MISPVYHNLNKIDSILKEHFGSDKVELIYPENQKKFDFLFIIESNHYKMKMIISETTALMMNGNDLPWSYFEDSNNNESRIIHRNSNLEFLGSDIGDIFEKKMFSKPYLESVQYVINESHIERDIERELFVEDPDNDIIEVSEKKLREVLESGSVIVDDLYIEDYDIIINLSSKEFNGSVNTANRVSIETKFNSYEEVDMAWFVDNKLNIKFDLKPELY